MNFKVTQSRINIILKLLEVLPYDSWKYIKIKLSKGDKTSIKWK